LIVADDDTTCPKKSANDLVKRLTNVDNFVTIPSVGHDFFKTESSATYVKLLERELVASDPTYISFAEDMYDTVTPAVTGDGTTTGTTATSTTATKKDDDDDGLKTYEVILIAIAMVCVVCIIVVIAMFCMKVKIAAMPKLEKSSILDGAVTSTEFEAKSKTDDASNRIDIANNAITPVLDK